MASRTPTAALDLLEGLELPKTRPIPPHTRKSPKSFSLKGLSVTVMDAHSRRIISQPSIATLHSAKEALVKKFRRDSPATKAPQIQMPLISTHDWARTPSSMSTPMSYIPSLETVAVELSNIPPSLNKADIQALFKDFHILELELPKVTRFQYPFRTTIQLSASEAEKAVKKLNGVRIGGRKISVHLKELEEQKTRAQEVADLADELKSAIVNTARTCFPHLQFAILEIQEISRAKNNFAFLQARRPVTLKHGSQLEEASFTQTVQHWGFVAGGMAELELARDQSTYDVRLEALKNLADEIENQGVLRVAWEKWEKDYAGICNGAEME